jgi:hypothetical protein
MRQLYITILAVKVWRRLHGAGCTHSVPRTARLRHRVTGSLYQSRLNTLAYIAKLV